MTNVFLAQHIEQIRDSLGSSSVGADMKDLKKRIMAVLGDEKVKPLFAGIVENPEDHEELMMELIENKGFSEPEPYKVFTAVVDLGMDYLLSMTARAMRGRDKDQAISLTAQAEALALKINNFKKAQILWLNLDRMAEEIGIVDDEMKQNVLIRIADIREKNAEYREAAGILDFMLTNCREDFKPELRMFLMIKHAETLHKAGDSSRATDILQSVINKTGAENGSAVFCARAWLSLSRIVNSGADLREAIRHYINTIEEAARAEENDVLIAAADELGLVFIQNDQPQESWDVLNQAYNTAMGNNDYGAMVHLLKTMWYSCLELKKWGDYLVLLRSAHHFVTGNEITPLIGTVNEYYARTHLEMGNNAEAQRYLDQASEAFSAINDEEGLTNIEELTGRLVNN